MKKYCLSILVLSFLLGPASNVFAEDTRFAGYPSDKNFTLTERTDLRRYDNGKYTGLFSREIRSFVTPKMDVNGVSDYSGLFYVLKKTKRNLADVRESINMAVDVDFSVDTMGSFSIENECGYPSFRNFPQLPVKKLSPGDSWTGTSYRCVNPSENGRYTLIPMVVSYKCIGMDVWKNMDVMVVSASWATRYTPAMNLENKNSIFDSSLSRAAGSHNATLYISCDSGKMVLCRDTIDEMYTYFDGNSVSYKGTINLFMDYASSVDRKAVVSSIRDNGMDKKIDGVSVKDSDSGLVLTISNLQFEPDSAVLLSGEKNRLDMIAQVLSRLPNSVFLVTGHAASTGNPVGEQQVSEERAKSIVEALIKRGIPSENLVCSGAGSSKPVASNETPEGKAANRRVEITILE